MDQPDGFSIIACLDQGVAGGRIDSLASQLGLHVNELAPVLAINPRTLHRFRHITVLNCSTAERIILLELLVAHGLDIFDGDGQVFSRWLRYPLGELMNRSPLQLLTSITGIGLVDDVLTRIDYGVYV